MTRNLCKLVLQEGGEMIPLLIDAKDSKGLGLMNPTILVEKDKILLNLRNINYTLYHCEGEQLFNNRWGPLSYLHPENDQHLRTYNFMCHLNPETLEIQNYSLTDTKDLDVDPLWDFVGLEDARLVRWEGKLYQCGVRRDTTPNGVGRMEMTELEEIDTPEGKRYKEISRGRIDPPGPATYCEKNWMPVLDMPYHFVKWSNPLQVVKVNMNLKKKGKYNTVAENVFVGNSTIPGVRDFRGGSQIIPYKDYRITMVHEVDLFNNRLEQKDATYWHRFLVWDKNWNVVSMSEPFSFMDGEIEFSCGLAFYKGNMLAAFGFQDNAAYILKIPGKMVDEILGLKKTKKVKKEKWKASKWPTLEITTSIPKNGCVIDCLFCPQNVLKNAYKGERTLSIENFKKAIDKVPTEVTIIFSGFCEPWMNKNATEMALYAHEKGHKISIFTTGSGMNIDDVNKLKNIKYLLGPEDPLIGTNGLPIENGGFVLHIPDNEGYSKHKLTDSYLKLLEYISSIQEEIEGFKVVCLGTPHDKVKHLFTKFRKLDIWARADNLVKEEEFKPELQGTYYRSYQGDSNITCGCDEKLYHEVMLPNGDVVLCCMDYNLEHILGNLITQEYNDILPDENTPFNLCRFCENGIKVK